MSRIRSIHPGLWTDEDFVTLSPLARLLYMGIWNECDDKGIFEWKPLTLKMRLLPGDNADVAQLLAEIEAIGAVRRYEIAGKAYGAVRNFCKFQRPKKPNNIHPVGPEILTYVGHSGEFEASEVSPVPHQFPTASENAKQMEDGGGREGGEERKKAYAFSVGDVRLIQSDYDDWRSRFHAIPDFEAELTTLSAWLKDQPAEKRKRWFATGASWLNRRHQEALRTAKADEAGVVIGI